MNFIRLQSPPRLVRLAGWTLVSTSMASAMASAQVAPRRTNPMRPAQQPSAKMRVEKDISYLQGTTNPLQTLDIYAPKTGTALPVAIFVHGGGFANGDKGSGAGIKPLAFTREGFVFVSVNYRLSPAVKHPAHVEDVAKAIAWTKANVARFGGNPDKLFVMGHSAGAHIAAMVAINGQFLEAEKLSLSDLSGAILLDGGTYDIAASLADSPAQIKEIKPAFGTDRAVWRDASPIYQVAKGRGIPPFLMIYVSYRQPTRRQATDLAAALTKAGVFARVVPAQNKNHATLNQELGAPDDIPTRQVFDFLHGILATGPRPPQQPAANVAGRTPPQNPTPQIPEALQGLNLTPAQRDRVMAVLQKHQGQRRDPQMRPELREILTPAQIQALRPERRPNRAR